LSTDAAWIEQTLTNLSTDNKMGVSENGVYAVYTGIPPFLAISIHVNKKDDDQPVDFGGFPWFSLNFPMFRHP